MAALTKLPSTREARQKKDWIEEPIVPAPTILKPAAPSCWDDFRDKAHYMPWVT